MATEVIMDPDITQEMDTIQQVDTTHIEGITVPVC